MTGDELPDDGHVVRYVKPSLVEDLRSALRRDTAFKATLANGKRREARADRVNGSDIGVLRIRAQVSMKFT